MSFYGLYVAINQQVTLQNQDPVLNETAELLGLSLRMTEDQLTRDMLAATALINLKKSELYKFSLIDLETYGIC
jgi:replicative DNA helicase